MVLEHVNILLVGLSTQSLFDKVMYMHPFSAFVLGRADTVDGGMPSVRETEGKL